MAQRSTRIVRDDDICGGEPIIQGRRITVRRIHALVEGRELPPKEVAQKFDIDIAAVEAALAYYESHPDVIEALERRQSNREQNAAQAGMKDISEYRPNGE